LFSHFIAFLTKRKGCLKSPDFLAPKSLRQLADELSDYQHLKEPPLGGRGQKTAFETASDRYKIFKLF